MANDIDMSVLEKDFPHIAERAMAFWGRDEFYAFMTGLVTTDRPGRAGFPDAAADEILFLEQIHELLYPHKRPDWTYV